MPLKLTETRSRSSRPVHVVGEGAAAKAMLEGPAARWAKEAAFAGKPGRVLLLPDADGRVHGALLGIGSDTGARAALHAGALARLLPAGAWHFAGEVDEPELAALALLLGDYRFSRYRRNGDRDVRFAVPGKADVARARLIADGVFLARDLINTPANDMGPEALEKAVRTLGSRHKAQVTAIRGDTLLKRNFPMIHAVGRAAGEAPRLVDLKWGPANAPKVTLVGKGVCFDTGGLDIKPASGMLLMKKDMGGAASVLGLASMIMDAKLKLRLRLLIPAVENAISAGAFRPGDVLQSRKGMTVEVGNTDAEGRLVLADALALADEDKPRLLVDMATLTGAARVALGPDVPPFYTDDDDLAGRLAAGADALADPLWRMPLWRPYAEGLSSRVADIGNVTTNGFAGSITAALFLSRFVEQAESWVHLDIYGWNPAARPHAPVGGEAQGIRALFQVVSGLAAK